MLRYMTLAFVLISLSSLNPQAMADWPTYRGDAERSGYTDAALPGTLGPRWRDNTLRPPQPAWSGRDTRTPFDAAFQPVLAGGKVFYGSSVDCRIVARDAATSEPQWEFFTDAPVRFAPAVWKDRVLAVSDDGFLYCLSADDGKLLWKLRGGPRNDMLLGNGRMISRWPARGGPVVADGIVYFAAGIWPSEGIYLRAVDIETGKVLWCNDTSGSIYMAQPHGGANAHSGVSAQGHLVVADDKLLVPTGRAVPAVFDRTDGKLLYFHLQANRGSGGSDVMAAEPLFFGGRTAFKLDGGATAGSGIDPATAAVTPEGIVSARGNSIVEIQIIDKTVTDRKGIESTVPGLSEPVVLVDLGAKPACSLIVAGSTIVVGSENTIRLFDRKSKELLQTLEVDGMPYGLAVAEERLVVSTDKGRLHCFEAGFTGEEERLNNQPHVDWDSPDMDLYERAFFEIDRKCHVTEGYCLDLGCGDGQLAELLAIRTDLFVIAIDPDPKNVAKARRRLKECGLYGTRVVVHQGDPSASGYPNFCADLIVSSRSLTEGPDVVSQKEIDRLLRPGGGVACVGRPWALKKTVRAPLEGADSWTHQYADAGNSGCSDDTHAKGPLGMLWFDDLNYPMPNRHGRGPAPLVLDGRMFIEGLSGLLCVDAYNGRTIWKRPLPPMLSAYDQEHLMGTAGTGSNICVTRGGIYLAQKDFCRQIDPATGRPLTNHYAPKLPDGSEGVWSYLACVDKTLFGTLANTDHLVTHRFGRSDMSAQFTESQLLFAMDANSGRLKWTFRPERSIRNNAIAIANGRIFLIDRERSKRDDARRTEQDKTATHEPGVLIALDAQTGKTLWKQTENIYGTMLIASEKHDVLLMAYQNTRFKLDSELGGRMAAFGASDGKRLWDIAAPYASRPIVNDRTIYAQPGAWDLMTGKAKPFAFARSYGCGILAGSKHLLTYRSATLGYTDLLEGSEVTNYGGIRPGCWINAIPAGGLVLMPDATDRCSCSYLIKATIALQPMR